MSPTSLTPALCVDAYGSLADNLAAARDALQPDDHAGRWWAICRAYRDWSLAHPADFALIFGTPVPGYQAPEHVTGPATGRVVTIAIAAYADAVQAGASNLDRTQVPPNLRTGELLHGLLRDPAIDYPHQLAGVTLTAFASLLGFLVTEIFGSLTQLIADTDQLYRAHLRTVMLGMGYQPDLIEAAASRR